MRPTWMATAAFVLAFLTLASAGEKLVPLKFELPTPIPGGTHKNIKLTPHMEPPKPFSYQRPKLLVPEGAHLLSLGKPVTSSDDEPSVGELEMITDGDKRVTDGTWVVLGPTRQWVQIDLEAMHAIYAIVVWHYHYERRIYHDVIVQIADDADFLMNVRTIYNNDYDNTAGLGIGKDKEYFEDFRGRLIPVKGLKARYVRLYSQGNTSDDLNQYVEVEVWGKKEAGGRKLAPLTADLPEPVCCD